MKRNQFELTIDSRLENLSVIAEFLATSMTQLDIRKGIHEVQLAVDEACTNIIHHAYSGERGTITISCEIQDNDLVITIKDSGSPFDPSAVPPPDLRTNLEERRVGGLGIHLMRNIMDEVSYDFDSEKGNTLIMRKTLTKMK